MPTPPPNDPEHWLQVLADSTPAYLAYVSAEDLRYRYVNHAFEKGFGRPRAEIIGRHILELIGQANYDFALPYINRVRAGETVSYENSFLLKHGRRWARVNYQPDLGPDGKVVGIFVLTYDVTERHLAEEETRRQKEFAERLIDTAQVVVVVVDPEGRVLHWNRAMEEASGFTRTEMLGNFAYRVLYPEADHPRVREALKRALAGDSPPRQRAQIRTRSGEVRTIEWNTRPLRDQLGEVMGLLATGQDLTDQLLAAEERQRLERELLQAQKLDAIGKLAGGVAHDMNNVLGAITGFASVLERKVGPDPVLREGVEGILDAAQRGAELTRNLLGFARKGNYRNERVDLNAVVAQTYAMLSRTIPREIALVDRLAPSLPPLEGDPGQLQQVLVNLILNAVDATPVRGSVTVATALVDAGAAARLKLPARPHLRVTVSDSGVGMEAGIAARAFEPFFTTKAPGAGTGLGLAMVYGAVQSHGGQVSLASAPGKGTTVTILLPALDAGGAAAAASSSSSHRASLAPFQPGIGTVLVVDDEPLVRTSTARMLGSIGYQVVGVAGGLEAVARLEPDPGRFAAVVLDLVMPVMNGEETFQRLRALAPAIPVLLTTGHARENATARLAASEHVAFLQKPFGLGALAEALATLIGPPPRAFPAGPD